ncbi:MAG TPA: response regulator [Thermoanaerobaculaceae bacterium]|nr:response regulator [Thermoanaerobaculaceae bacterium]
MCASRTISSRPSPTLTVAVVDDDAAARRALTRILRAGGLRVASFSTAEELLQEYETTHPGCLVLDVMLPGMSGPDLVDRLQSSPGAPSVVFVTGRIDSPHTLKQRGLGHITCLQKPFEPGLLLEAVAQAMKPRG